MFYKPGILVVGRKTAGLTAALDVLDGKAASLGQGIAVKKGRLGRRVTVLGKASPLAAAIPADAMFMGRAINVAESKLPAGEHAPLVKATESVSVDFGIKGEEVFFDADLVAKSPELATLFKSALDGGRAMAILQFAANNEAMTKLLNSFKLDIAGNRVTARWRATADELWMHAEAAHSQYESNQ